MKEYKSFDDFMSDMINQSKVHESNIANRKEEITPEDYLKQAEKISKENKEIIRNTPDLLRGVGKPISKTLEDLGLKERQKHIRGSKIPARCLTCNGNLKILHETFRSKFGICTNLKCSNHGKSVMITKTLK